MHAHNATQPPSSAPDSCLLSSQHQVQGRSHPKAAKDSELENKHARKRNREIKWHSTCSAQVLKLATDPGNAGFFTPQQREKTSARRKGQTERFGPHGLHFANNFSSSLQYMTTVLEHNRHSKKSMICTANVNPCHNVIMGDSSLVKPTTSKKKGCYKPHLFDV